MFSYIGYFFIIATILIITNIISIAKLSKEPIHKL